jgi:hypothetical protein
VIIEAVILGLGIKHNLNKKESGETQPQSSGMNATSIPPSEVSSMR